MPPPHEGRGTYLLTCLLSVFNLFFSSLPSVYGDGDPGAGPEQDVHHGHVPVPAGPVDGPRPLAIIAVQINPSALLN